MDDIRDIKPAQPIWPKPRAQRPTPNRRRREDPPHRSPNQQRKPVQTPEGRPHIDEYV
jgi:hypothetical protein